MAVCICSTAHADNMYICKMSDDDVMFTNVKKSGCKLFIKGAASAKNVRKSPSRSYTCKAVKPSDWDEYEPVIQDAADKYNLPAYLIKAVIKAESDRDPCVISSAGAEGLMQLMPGTAADMEVRNSFDPNDNIMGGAKYLRTLANMFDGDLVLMLAGYNAGHNRVIENGNKVPKIAETKDYIKRVMNYYYKFKKEYISKQGKPDEKPET